MDSQHIIEQTVFDISFSTEDDAFAQQAVLNTFVSDGVLAVVDDVFDEFTDIHSVLRIDFLEVDLGVVSYQNYQAEITARLREQLSVRLREWQAISRTGGDDGVLSIERRFSDLEMLHYVIRYGHLPWYSQTYCVADRQQKFMRVVELQCENLIRLLASIPVSSSALDNLAEVLPLDGLILMARQLLRKEFDRVLKIIEHLTDYQLSQGCFKRVSRQHREACMRDLWSALIAAVLHANGTNRNVAAAIRVFLMRCVDGNLFEFEKLRIKLRQSGIDNVSEITRFLDDHVIDNNELSQKRLISLSRLVCVLADNNVVKLRALWRSFLSDDTDNKQRVGEMLRHIAFYVSCRNQIIEQFTEKMLYEWFSITNANEIEYIMACQAYFMHARSNQSRSEKKAYSDFWNYTLRYCASYESHQFDRSQFLYHLLHKESRSSENKNKLLSFSFVDKNNPFINDNHELQVVLDSWQHELEFSVSERLSEAGQLDAVTLSEYLAGAHPTNLKKISAQWPFVLETHSVLLLHRVRLYGYKTAVRQALIGALSSSQLRDLVGLLAPLSKTFTHDVVTLFSGVSSSGPFSGVDKSSNLCDEHCLWGFTLDFILVESGNHFNKKEYCGSLLRKMAAHHNCSYGELLDIMQPWFLAIAERHRITQDLVLIINDLVDDYSQFRPSKRVAFVSSENEVVELSQADVSDHLHDSTLATVTYENEEALKKRFALILGKRALVLSSSVLSLINAITSCLGKEQREKIQLDALMFSDRYFSSGASITPEVFIRLLANYLMARSGYEAEHFYARVILQLNQADTDQPVAQKIIKNLSALVFPRFANAAPSPVVTETSLFDGAAVYINNAGQVLLTPYFPILFDRLGLVKEGQFIDEAARTRAVYALQYMVDGVGELPEYMMILNKLICGVESRRLAVREAVIRDAEKKLIDGLLAAAIENWQGLGHTSVNGLRESFLKREGKLQLVDNQWHLLVESRSYDMLLDRMPWSYSTIKHAWMERVIHVEWR